MKHRIRVLVVDDHRLMLEGITRILRGQPDIDVVGMADSGEGAIAQYRATRPDVVLMDLELGGISGVQAIRAIRAQDPDARIVVVTMYSGQEDVFRSLEAGAAAYVLKSAIPAELIRIVKAVHAGHRAVSPEIAAIFQNARQRPALTSREQQVLQLLADGKRDKEIAESLRISPRTAHVHIHSIFTKLDVHDRTSALRTALRQGLVQRS
jgi:DNA-binding NarL/FixJ family response regulator